MTIEISFDDDSEVIIVYDNATVLKVTRVGDGNNDFKFSNFDNVDDDNIAVLIKSFAKGLLLV